MCGIAGFISFKPTPANTILRMTEAVRHRGPDDEGYALFGAASPPTLFGGRDTPAAVYAADMPYAPRQAISSDAASFDAVALGFRRLAIIDVSAAGHQPMCRPDGRVWIVYNGEIYN